MVWRFAGLMTLGVFTLACGEDEPASGSTGAPPTLGTPKVELLVEGAEIQGANGMFFDAQNRLYVASVNSARLYVLDRETGNVLETVGEAKGVLSLAAERFCWRSRTASGSSRRARWPRISLNPKASRSCRPASLRSSKPPRAT